MFAGFDLGAHCGYAILSESGQRIVSGTINLGKRTPQSIASFYDQLLTLARKHDIAQVLKLHTHTEATKQSSGLWPLSTHGPLT
jgi:hypothetical protein